MRRCFNCGGNADVTHICEDWVNPQVEDIGKIDRIIDRTDEITKKELDYERLRKKAKRLWQ